MSFSLFKQKKGPTLQEFIEQLKRGERDFHKILKTKPGSFRDASFEQLMSNPDDVIRNVNRVEMNFNNFYFGIFENCLIKHTDDGDIKFTFYTYTDNANKVIEIANILISQFGQGFFDSKQYSSFLEEHKIHAVANSLNIVSGDEPGQHWQYDNLSFALHFLASPSKQFMLDITINAPKQVDFSVRRNGTVLDLLKFNISSLLTTEPVHERPETVNDRVKFVDYTYHLEPKEFDLFNVIEIRIFSEKREFNKFVQTHITLYTIGPTEPNNKIRVVESLQRMYGLDCHSSGELEFYERDKIEEGSYWLGRTWRFNNEHALQNPGNKNETFSYEIRVENMEDEYSFKVAIFCYHNLVALFGLS